MNSWHSRFLSVASGVRGSALGVLTYVHEPAVPKPSWETCVIHGDALSQALPSPKTPSRSPGPHWGRHGAHLGVVPVTASSWPRGGWHCLFLRLPPAECAEARPGPLGFLSPMPRMAFSAGGQRRRPKPSCHCCSLTSVPLSPALAPFPRQYPSLPDCPREGFVPPACVVLSATAWVPFPLHSVLPVRGFVPLGCIAV